ncbi:PVC-type heme-binding CxxCH protein [Planctomicrobium piriforme]|uniref:Putative membrane-bound dehydrogenase domain-containing protein n=1 Tax=Planctomicrobium piriforme TaxID=1576369 RepID=A0A1I3IN29_9PLAN|nr:PVC-type heme-binding CxxCH protein [Planctomicrobium piriforme]SFI49237.1 putative membrane-bound dehydrogenase domain-containing protein [Planctomicrobium piriforme]
MLDSTNRTLIAFLAVFLTACSAASAEDFPLPINTEKSTTTPMDPAEVVRTAKLPPGFKLTAAAAEPQVQNPIAITTDERGRLWVAENYSWAGGGAGGFDPAQRDRIVVLEDTNGDGTLDKRTVFWDDAHKLTSIEIGNGGVWALCLPNLLFLPDRNRDDVLDSPPQVVLDGFNETTVGHTPANGLKWGPDGWLYGRHGIQATSSIGKPGSSDSQRFKINTGVWRFHPGTGVGEALMHGMTNSWGFDYDQYGEIFVINTVIGHLWHVLPGSHVQRMYGLDMNPHSYRLIEQVADHVHWDSGEVWNDVRKGVTDKTSAAGGGHAHIGLMIYQGDNWPDEYRNRVYTLNLHGARINTDILVRKNAGYTATHGPDFCFLSDPWYRGMDLITGADGGVYIADWSDTGECHDHDGVHRTSGRIYKLTYGQPQAIPKFDLSTRSSAELISLLSHKNAWWPRQAQRLLGDRVANGLPPAELSALQAALKQKLKETTDGVVRIRILETLAATGGFTEAEWISALASKDEYQRVAALRILLDQGVLAGTTPSPQLKARMIELAGNDPSGLVQLTLASALQRLPVDDRWSLAEPLVTHAEFANDRMLPLMIWYGIETSVPRDPSKALALIQNSRMPIVTECIARRLTMQIESDPASCERLLDVAINGKCAAPESVVTGMALALNGWQKAPAPSNWPQATAKFSKSENAAVRTQVQDLNVVFGDGRALDQIRELVTNASLDPETRRQALRSLLISRPDDYIPTLFKLLSDRIMVREAIHGLALYDHPEIPAKILARAGNYDPAERAEMIQTLVSRPAYAKALLDAVRNKKVAANELTAFHARQICSFNNDALTKELTELWGDVRVSAAEKRALIDSRKSSLTTDVLANADLSAGRATFQKTCANCHVLFGAGRRLGPDLTGSNRKNIDYLLENMIDPSASVGADFRSVVLTLEDGRVLNGVVSEQNERTLTLQSAQDSVTLDRKSIEEMRPTTVSLMPDGLLQNLTPDQVRDLIGYLMSSEQVPLPNP